MRNELILIPWGSPWTPQPESTQHPQTMVEPWWTEAPRKAAVIHFSLFFQFCSPHRASTTAGESKCRMMACLARDDGSTFSLLLCFPGSRGWWELQIPTIVDFTNKSYDYFLFLLDLLGWILLFRHFCKMYNKTKILKNDCNKETS